MDQQQESHSNETVIALLQRDISYIRIAQDKQSEQLTSLDKKIDSTYVTHETLNLKLGGVYGQLSWHNKVFAFIGVTIASALIYAFLKLIIK